MVFISQEIFLFQKSFSLFSQCLNENLPHIVVDAYHVSFPIFLCYTVSHVTHISKFNNFIRAQLYIKIIIETLFNVVLVPIKTSLNAQNDTPLKSLNAEIII